MILIKINKLIQEIEDTVKQKNKLNPIPNNPVPNNPVPNNNPTNNNPTSNNTLINSIKNKIFNTKVITPSTMLLLSFLAHHKK